jgi:hypothetical protein
MVVGLDDYLERTEFVVRHTYEGLHEIWNLYEEGRSYWNVSRIGEPETPELTRDRKRFLELGRKYFGLKISEGILSGTILHVLHIALGKYSENEIIPDSFQDIPQIHRARRFAVGPLVHEMPVGLIIYAARNQWAHWMDDELREPSRTLFNRLAAQYFDDPMWDLALDLSNPTIDVYANEVLLGVLRLTDYSQYQRAVDAIFNANAA